MLDETASAGSMEAKAIMSGSAKYSWLSLLFSAARYYLDREGNEKLVAKKLVYLGRRYGKNFLGIPKSPMFGMLHRGGFVSCFRDKDNQIDFLLKVAENIRGEMGLENNQIFIRYRHQPPGSSKAFYEYATALAWSRGSAKRTLDNSEHRSQLHYRWLYAGTADLRKERLSDYRYESRLSELCGPDDVPSEFTHWHAVWRADRMYTPSMGGGGGGHFDRHFFDAAECLSIQKDFKERARLLTAKGEDVIRRESQFIEDFAVKKMGIS